MSGLSLSAVAGLSARPLKVSAMPLYIGAITTVKDNLVFVSPAEIEADTLAAAKALAVQIIQAAYPISAGYRQPTAFLKELDDRLLCKYGLPRAGD